MKRTADIKVVRNKKSKNSLLPNMKELFDTNRLSHFPPFYDDLDWAFCQANKTGGHFGGPPIAGAPPNHL